MSRASFGLQLLIFVVLAALVGAELRHGFHVRAVAPVEVGKAYEVEPIDAFAFTMPERSAFSETLERPLFLKTRRPPASIPQREPVVEVAKTREPDVGPFILSAIVIVEDQRAVLLTDPRNGQLTRRKEGEIVGGWELDEIHSDGVVLTHSGERKEVPLRRFGSSALAANQNRGKKRQVKKNDRASRELEIRKQQIKKLQQKLKTMQSNIAKQGSQSAGEVDEESCGLSRC